MWQVLMSTECGILVFKDWTDGASGMGCGKDEVTSRLLQPRVYFEGSRARGPEEGLVMEFKARTTRASP